MSSNTSKNKTLNDFLIRLLYYTLGVTGTMLLLSITGWVFYSQGEDIRDALGDYIECRITNELTFAQVGFTLEPCNRGKKINVFWFMSWVIACFVAILSQMILACNQNQRRRLKRFKTTVVENISIEKSKSSRNKNNTIPTTTSTPNSSRYTNKRVLSVTTSRYDDDNDNQLPDQDLEMQEMNSRDNVGNTNTGTIENNLTNYIDENETIDNSDETPTNNSNDDTPTINIDETANNTQENSQNENENTIENGDTITENHTTQENSQNENENTRENGDTITENHNTQENGDIITVENENSTRENSNEIIPTSTQLENKKDSTML